MKRAQNARPSPSLAIRRHSPAAYRLTLTVLGLLSGLACFQIAAAELDADKLPPAAKGEVDFARDIQPILETDCLRCHGPEKPKSHFRLDNRDSALKGGNDNPDDVVPGDSSKSKLIFYVARQVEDLEMPPEGKGEPLAAEQVGLLRAWIDQGASWGAVKTFPQSAISTTPELRWIGVQGNAAKFRELDGTKEGVGAGLDQFSLKAQSNPDEKISMEGHFLFPDRDFQVKLTQEKTDLGFMRAGFETWRKYYDDTGGFAPLLPTNSFRLDRDLHMDLGRAWFDLGLTLPNGPQIVVGYEYQFKQGSESTLQWGPVGTKSPIVPGTDAKNVFPASERVDEHTHILKLDVDYDLAGWQLADRTRVEFYSLSTARTNVLADSFGPTPTTLAGIVEKQHQVQGANTLSVSKQLKSWWSVSVGYLYSRLEGDAGYQQNTLNGSGALIGGDQWSANNILLKRESQIVSFGTLLGPWSGLSLSSGVQAEWTRQEGTGLENILLPVPITQPPPPPTNMIIGNLDTADARENVEVRYTTIPYTVLYAEGHLEQQSFDQSQLGKVRGAGFTRNSDADIESEEYRVGFNSSPWQRVSLGASFKHSSKSTDYTNIKNNAIPDYPGFIEWRNIADSQVDARLVYRATSWLTTTLNYRYQDTDFHSATPLIPFFSPGGSLKAATDQEHVYSANVVVTPFRRLFLSSTFSYSDSRTAAAFDGRDGLVPYQGNVYTVINSGTFALNPRTSLTANYVYSRADYGQNNAADNLPAGIDYERHELRLGVTRRFAKGIVTNVSYGFSRYREPTLGGADDFTAHSIFATIAVPWP